MKIILALDDNRVVIELDLGQDFDPSKVKGRVRNYSSPSDLSEEDQKLFGLDYDGFFDVTDILDMS